MTQFSETLMDYFQSPRNQGEMESPDCVGVAGIPGQGRYIQLFVRLTEDRVEQMRFHCYGCGVTVAVCSALTELVERQTKLDCENIGIDDVVRLLDGVPAHKMDVVHFGIAALKLALEDWSRIDESRVGTQKESE